MSRKFKQSENRTTMTFNKQTFLYNEIDVSKEKVCKRKLK